MSEANGVEKEQQAPTTRERATGPLVPGWFKTLFYALFGPFCVVAIVYIAYSVHVQSQLTWATRVVVGDLTQMADLSSPEGRRAVEVLSKHALSGWIYLNQELLRDEVDDGRMARLLALRKAAAWGRTSTRREIVREMVAHMTDTGAVEGDFTVSDEMRAVLAEMAAERRADPEMTYAENRVTEVLEWLAAGHPGQPKGPEKRRMQALQRQLAKTVFVGVEAKALAHLAEEWAESSDARAKEAAVQFSAMLENKKAALSPEAEAYCMERADYWQAQYEEGMHRAASVGLELLDTVLTEGKKRIDHPHIYQYLSLLGDPVEGVREEVAKGAWLFRGNKFGIRFLSYYGTKTAINPVMAVETVRLTKEEHERKMRRENSDRLRASIELLGRIGADYALNSAEYDLGVRDQDAYMRTFVVHALQQLKDERSVGALAEQALDAVRQADARRPGGRLFFSEDES